MKTLHVLHLGTLIGLALAIAPGANAQNTPSGAAASAPQASAAAVVTTAASAPAQPAGMTGFDKVVYVSQLPSVGELSASLPAGLTLVRIELSNGQVAVYYRNSSGETSSVAYALLAPVGTPAPAPATVVSGPAANNVPTAPVAAPGTPAPAVSYSYLAPAPQTYYYYTAYSYPVAPSYYYDYGYPYPYFYPFGNVRIGIGIGIGGGGRDRGRRR